MNWCKDFLNLTFRSLRNFTFKSEIFTKYAKRKVDVLMSRLKNDCINYCDELSQMEFLKCNLLLLVCVIFVPGQYTRIFYQ